MKKLFNIVLALSFSLNCFADCDFKTGIKQEPDGSRLYTEACHIKVGEMKRDLEVSQKQNADYIQAIKFKDLAIQHADEREKNWMETSQKMQNRIEQIDKLRKQQEWIYYGLGVLTVVGLGFAVHQISP